MKRQQYDEKRAEEWSDAGHKLNKLLDGMSIQFTNVIARISDETIRAELSKLLLDSDKDIHVIFHDLELTIERLIASNSRPRKKAVAIESSAQPEAEVK